MRKLFAMAGLAAVTLLLVGAGSAAGSADTGTDAQAVGTLDLPKPAWLTDELEAQIAAAGPKGVEIARPDATVNPDCLGTAPPYVDTDGVSTTAVSAGTCMVSPSGCTMNFVFTDGTSYYIGTAGHCSGNGKTVIAQVGTRVDPTDTVFVTLAAIGTTVASWNSGIGKDFALVKINAGFKVIPGVTGALGPTGVFCVEPGYPKFGEVIPDLTLLVKFTTPDGFNWVGYGLPGDSGSEVMNDAGLAVGDLTHGIGIAGVPVPGLSFGTDMSEIFALIGSSYQLVTVDGRRVSCANPLGL